MELVAKAQKYVRELETVGSFAPLDRREPQTMLVDFISRIIGNGEKIESDLYLGSDDNDGDNGDNGHFLIDTTTGELLSLLDVNDREK